MSVVYRYLLILIACSSLLLGVQIPNFVDQYEKRLDAHLSEVKNNLLGYQDIADRLYGGSLDALITKHDQSIDQTFKQEALPIKNIVDRYQRFAKEQAALTGSLLGKVGAIVRARNRELIHETFNNYSFTIPLNESAVATGFIVMFGAVTVIELLRLMIMKFWGPGRRKANTSKWLVP